MINKKEWDESFKIDDFVHENDIVKPSDISKRLLVNNNIAECAITPIAVCSAVCSLVGTVALVLGGIATAALATHTPLPILGFLGGAFGALGIGVVTVDKLNQIKDKFKIFDKIYDSFDKNHTDTLQAEELPAYNRMIQVKEELNSFRKNNKEMTPEVKIKLNEEIKKAYEKIITKEEAKNNFKSTGPKFEGDWNSDFVLEEYISDKDFLLPSDLGKNFHKKSTTFQPDILSTASGYLGGLSLVGVLGAGVTAMSNGPTNLVDMGARAAIILATGVSALLIGLEYKKRKEKNMNDELDMYRDKHKDVYLKEKVIHKLDIPAYDRMNEVIEKTKHIRNKYNEPTPEYHKEMKSAIEDAKEKVFHIRTSVSKFLDNKEKERLEFEAARREELRNKQYKGRDSEFARPRLA